jgi:ABC-2 type transport system ATP-binding protein
MELAKNEVPAMVKAFVEEEIEVFGIKEVSKTLEDRFLEVTADKGAIDHD